jgi:hypothetical protein
MNEDATNRLNDRIDRQLRARDEDKKATSLFVLNNELKAVLNLNRPPGRLSAALTAAYLGFKVHDIPVLTARGLLKPLGCPMPNSDKYYARTRIMELADDEEWLSRATAALSQHWRNKNARKVKSQNGQRRTVNHSAHLATTR